MALDVERDRAFSTGGRSPREGAQARAADALRVARHRDVVRIARGRSRQVGASRAAETAISLARAFAPSMTSWLSLTRTFLPRAEQPIC